MNDMNVNVVVILFHLEIISFFLSTKSYSNSFYQKLFVERLQGRGKFRAEGALRAWGETSPLFCSDFE